jgi:hypothetical protein
MAGMSGMPCAGRGRARERTRSSGERDRRGETRHSPNSPAPPGHFIAGHLTAHPAIYGAQWAARRGGREHGAGALLEPHPAAPRMASAGCGAGGMPVCVSASACCGGGASGGPAFERRGPAAPGAAAAWTASAAGAGAGCCGAKRPRAAAALELELTLGEALRARGPRGPRGRGARRGAGVGAYGPPRSSGARKRRARPCARARPARAHAPPPSPFRRGAVHRLRQAPSAAARRRRVRRGPRLCLVALRRGGAAAPAGPPPRPLRPRLHHARPARRHDDHAVGRARPRRRRRRRPRGAARRVPPGGR